MWSRKPRWWPNGTRASPGGTRSAPQSVIRIDSTAVGPAPSNAIPTIVWSITGGQAE